MTDTPVVKMGQQAIGSHSEGEERPGLNGYLEKALGSPGGLVVPELLELLFQAPGPIDAAVVFVERLEICGIAPGAR